jgi:hypothetical protein
MEIFLMKNKKKKFREFPQDSPEYVLLHARWRISRGKRPSSAFMEERNPRKALELAIQAMEKEPERYEWLGRLRPLSHKELSEDDADIRGFGGHDDDEDDDFNYPDEDS